MFLRRLQASPDEFPLRRRCLDPPLRLLLEGVEHVDRTGEPHRVNRPVSVTNVVLDDLKDPRPAEPFEHLRIDVLSAPLSLPQCETDRLTHHFGELPQVVSTGTHPEERLIGLRASRAHSIPILA